MNPNRRRGKDRRAGAVLPACIALAAAAALAALPVIPASLVLRVEGRVVYERVVGAEKCEVEFVHSVNKGHIREVYRIDAATGVLALEQGYFQSYGAGMLDTAAETVGMNFRREDGYFVLDFPADWRQSIEYIGGDIAGHIFVYGRDRLPVGELYPGRIFSISVSRRGLVQRLLRI